MPLTKLFSSPFTTIPATCEIQQLLELPDPDDYVCSVKFMKEGNHLAVGTASSGDVELWDVEQVKKLRTMAGHTERVGSLSWNQVMRRVTLKWGKTIELRSASTWRDCVQRVWL